VAYVRDYDVYVFDLTKGKRARLTLGGTERVSHGLAEFVAQEEMDRYSGYWWSPDHALSSTKRPTRPRWKSGM
jgi:dipeptidyl-peptidase-4